MSTTRTYTALTGGGAGSAYQSGDRWGYQTAEKVRNGLDIASYLAGHLDLGGDETAITVAVGATYEPVKGYRSYDLNADTLGGLTLEAVVFYKTANAGTSVTVRVRNTTDSSTAATGTTSTSTSIVREVLTLTMASGVKTYRLELAGSNTSNTVAAWGYLRLRTVPA